MGLAKPLRLDKLMRVEDPADLDGLPVRAFRGVAGQRAAADQDRDAGAGADRREAEFGEDPDIDAVDAHVRRVMQKALDKLAKERRLPVIG